MQLTLWTMPFVALICTNTLLSAGFHFLLPTLPMYVESLGESGTMIGLITGLFGFSAIVIRLFTDASAHILGKKNCLYLGLVLSIAATMGYLVCNSTEGLIVSRLLHGFGFGMTTTFAASIVADIVPASRRGEGIGYFGLGSTVAMALAPALGLMLLTDFSAAALFISSAALTAIAIGTTHLSRYHEERGHAARASIPLKHRLYEHGTGVPSILAIIFGAAYGSVNTYIAMMAQEAGIEGAGLFFVIGTLFIFISRPFGGKLLDRFGSFAVVMPGAILYSIALVLVLMAQDLTTYLIAAAFHGLGGGLLLPSLLTWMLNVVGPERRNGASATFYNMLDVGTSTGILVLGSLAGVIGYINIYGFVLAGMVLFIAFTLLTHKKGSRA